jgi:hypothetical protein
MLLETRTVPIVFTQVTDPVGQGLVETLTHPHAAALHKAKRRKCSTVIAKLDRLSSDLHFIRGLMTQKVPFIVAELRPPVDPRGRAGLCWEGSHSKPALRRNASSSAPAMKAGRTGGRATPQYFACPGVRGNGIASRTLESPVT